MVFSTSVTSSPNGSSEVAAGGAAAGGACATAGERTAKLTAAAATADNHQIREGIIRFLPGITPILRNARLHDAATGWRFIRCNPISRASRQDRGMNALANHSFIKMNGLGNEIVVVDMRASPQAITAADARAAAAAAPYDQLMAVYPPRAVGTDAYVRIYNNDGSEAGACGNGMRCVADILFKQSGNSTLTVETRAGLLAY